VGKAFDYCEKKPVTVRTKQKKIMQFTIFKCYDFKGMKIKKTESF